MSNQVESELQNGSEDNNHDPQHEPSQAPAIGFQENYLINAANAAAATAEDTGNSGDMSPHAEFIREQDYFLPIANIYRIMRKLLPNNSKISKEAKEAIQECVSEFICFVTSEASDQCTLEKRKTITGEDVIWAMGSLGFDNYMEPLKTYLQRYREYMKNDKNGRKLRFDGWQSLGEELE